MNCVTTEHAIIYLSSARRRLSEAASLLTDAGIGAGDSCFALINAADIAIADLQRKAALTFSATAGEV